MNFYIKFKKNYTKNSIQSREQIASNWNDNDPSKMAASIIFQLNKSTQQKKKKNRTPNQQHFW